MAIKIDASWGMRNLDKVNHWQRIKLDKYPHDKPVVICLGGNGTVSENAANGFCKLAENYLQLLFKENGVNQVYNNVDLIGAVYPMGDNPAKGSLSTDDINQFVDDFLIRRIQDDNDELLPLNEACRRLSGVTFFSYCLGHHEVDLILSAFYRELKLLGYSSQECDILMFSMLEISYAPLTYNSIIPAVFVDSKQDKMLNSNWNKENQSDKDFNGIELRLERYGDKLLSDADTSKAIFDSIHIYSSRLRNNVESDEHNISILSRDGSWNTEYEPNADCVSQMIAWALCRAVENGIENKNSKKFIPKITLEKLLEELELIKNGFSSEQLMSEEKTISQYLS